jgi:hypothetical protein
VPCTLHSAAAALLPTMIRSTLVFVGVSGLNVIKRTEMLFLLIVIKSC